jgi:hypothetical protein
MELSWRLVLGVLGVVEGMDAESRLSEISLLYCVVKID